MRRATREGSRTVELTDHPITGALPDVQSLRAEVTQALLTVVRAADAPPMAVASASRELMVIVREMEQSADATGGKQVSGMTETEIDDELAREREQSGLSMGRATLAGR